MQIRRAGQRAGLFTPPTRYAFRLALRLSSRPLLLLRAEPALSWKKWPKLDPVGLSSVRDGTYQQQSKSFFHSFFYSSQVSTSHRCGPTEIHSRPLLGELCTGKLRF